MSLLEKAAARKARPKMCVMKSVDRSVITDDLSLLNVGREESEHSKVVSCGNPKIGIAILVSQERII